MQKILNGLHRAFAKQRSCGISRLTVTAVLAVAAAASAFVIFKSIKTIEVTDGSTTATVHSLTGSIENAVSRLGLGDGEYEILSLKKSGKHTSLSISRAFSVTVTVGEKQIKVTTLSDTVKNILKKAGYTLDEYDMVEPSADTVIKKSAFIDYTNIDYVTNDATETIPFGVRTVFSPLVESGKSTVSGGKNGLKKVVYKSKLVNGVETEKLVESEQVLSDAVEGVKTIGTGGAGAGVSVAVSSDIKCISNLSPSSPIKLDANGIPVEYTGHMTVQATAYTYTGHNCSTGVAPMPGYIAVNPNIIPYGTRMYIVSSDGAWVYGYAIAADTGGFTSSRPTNVDLFLSTEAMCYAFGRRNVEIYFLP